MSNPDGMDLFQKLSLVAQVSVDRLRELVEADRDGRCVVLPCKVGDILYEVDDPSYGVIVCKVKDVRSYWKHFLGISTNEIVKGCTVAVDVIEGHGKGAEYSFEDYEIGETVFLTRAEAEAALKGGTA